MTWPKIWLVLRREYLYNFKRPAFLFTAFGVPLISLAAMFLLTRLAIDRESDLSGFSRVGYVDHAQLIDAASIPDDSRFVPVETNDARLPIKRGAGVEGDTYYYDALESAARQQLLDGELDAYIVVSSTYVRSGQIDLYTKKDTPQALQTEIEDFLRDQITAQAGARGDVSQAVARRLSDPHDLTIRDLETGDELTEAAIIGRLMLPFVFVFLYFMATNTTAQFLMSGVVEEKENRLMEILATSLRPLELLWGKLFGLGALSLTQVALWATAGVVIVSLNEDAQDFVAGASFQAGDIVLVIALFVINFMVFSATMLGIGAAVTAESESRQIAGAFTMVNLLPVILSVTFFTNPDGALPLFFTFFPFTAAMGLILRMGLTTLPAWQIVLSVGIQLVTVVAVMWLAAKVFRLGMLMYGKPLTPRTFWLALREGRSTLTSAPEPVATDSTKKGLL
jgi:ABC-2 type transport system permease protein